jgi:predicted lipid-binding transport protein (Tim44 family)
MKRMTSALLSLLVATVIAGPALAQDFVIYPAKGQSNEQMEKDKFECYGWAKGQSGFDPMEMPKATAPPPPKQAQSSTAGGAAKGAVGGGLLGLGVGAIAGGKSGAAKGAGIGALSGAAIGGVRSHQQQKRDEQAQQQWADQQANQYMQKRSAYNRAYSACLEGKGYTVK